MRQGFVTTHLFCAGNDVFVVLMRFPSAPLPPVFAPQFLLPAHFRFHKLIGFALEFQRHIVGVCEKFKSVELLPLLGCAAGLILSLNGRRPRPSWTIFSLLSFVQTAFFEAIERLPCFGHAVWQSSKQKNSNGENCFLINNASRSQQTHGDFGCLCDLCDAKS